MWSDQAEKYVRELCATINAPAGFQLTISNYPAMIELFSTMPLMAQA